jgi:transcriptional regulator with XRE-family HTH domain
MKFRVKAYAQAQGYSIRSLASTAGLAYRTVFSLWHDQTMRPDERTLQKIAQTLQIADWRDLIAPEIDSEAENETS